MFFDHFIPLPMYGEELFKHWYWMSCNLFMRLFQALCEYNSFSFANMRLHMEAWFFFNLKTHYYTLHVCIWSKGWCSKWILPTLLPTSQEYIHRMCEMVCASCNNNFLTKVLLETHKTCIGNHFKINVKRGFLGMFVSFDFMHYKWKNYLIGWHLSNFKTKMKEFHNLVD
jgi:hypothetical protein